MKQNISTVRLSKFYWIRFHGVVGVDSKFWIVLRALSFDYHDVKSFKNLELPNVERATSDAVGLVQSPFVD